MSKLSQCLLSSFVISFLTPILWGQSISSVSAKPKPKPAQINSPQPKTENIYEKAKKELPEDLYVVYRIVDRLARANNLDRTPWRIAVIQEYNVNAFATDQNLIAVYSGLLDQIEGDASAIACVVGHEMTHHTQRHIAMGEAEKKALVEKYTQEAELEVKQEAQSTVQEATGASFGGALLQGLGGMFGGIGSSVGNLAGGTLNTVSQQRVEDGKKRMAEIVKQKQEELEKKNGENDRHQELEADQIGYQYMAKAGFDPQGCLRMMEVLGRMPGSEMDTTHPATRKRLTQINSLMTEKPASILSQEGKLRLDTSKPLTYSLSRDDKSLRVNSQYGGSSADTIDKMF